MRQETWVRVFLVALFFTLWPAAGWAISADELLNLLIEEKVITVEKAEKIREKARKLDEAKKARKVTDQAREPAPESQTTQARERAEAPKEAQVAARQEAPKSKPKIEVGYQRGFYVQTADQKFRARVLMGIQPRFTYLARDYDVLANRENTAYFRMRRLRLFFDGNAFAKDLKYSVQVQLEPQSAVNVHDANVWFSRWKFFQPWLGRGKIAYGLEFWQSGFKLNFIDRSLFSGETDNDWPGGNVDFEGPNASAGVGNESYNTGGFNLGRSQGFMLMGDLDLWAPRNLRYWLGIWNGPNTRGLDDMNDAEFCYAGRVLFAPLPNGGPDDAELSMQGDYNYHRGLPLFYLLYSMFTNRDRNTANRPGTDVAETFKTANHGFDLAACLKWHGFSLQAEWAREWFTEFRPNVFIPGQLGQGQRSAQREAWYVAAGFFFWPKRLELVTRYAYANRVKSPDNPYTQSFLSTNADEDNFLFPVRTNGAVALGREGILREYTVGLNCYLNGHAHKYMIDYSRLIRGIYRANNQQDDRFRFMAQWRF
jgi:hypothetical protein